MQKLLAFAALIYYNSFNLLDKRDPMQSKKNVLTANESSGFRLEIFNFFIIVFTVIVTVALTIVVFKAHSTYDAFYEATEEYIACRQSAEQVHEASELLTNQVRAYSFTGDYVHIENYFNEATVTKRREHALKTIKEYVQDESKSVYLENAVSYSEELMNIEYYAMRLRLEADGVSEDKYPEAVKTVTLKPEDAALSDALKIELAKDLVQNNTYDDYKDKIYRNVSLYTQDLLDGTRKRETENSKMFSKYQQIQMIFIVLLICVLMINVAFTTIFLIRPLRKSSKLIVEQNLIPVKGTQEMRTFALLYNKALQKTKSQHERLSYSASHDSLTGINNRSVFDGMCRTLSETSDITLAIVDIDNFKQINDTNGHEAGDMVLKAVASLLRDPFRSSDIICRIGGDEFAVIINGVSSNSKDLLENKMQYLIKKLGDTNNDLPAATLSIGIAFGDEKCSFNSLYKQADEALYSVKSTTKNHYKFYGV